MNSRKGQEEIVGFALIIIIVAVVLLFLLSFSLKSPKKEAVEGYEATSFVQSMLQYTVECGNRISKRDVSVQRLIEECSSEDICVEKEEDKGIEEVTSCKMLNTTLTDLTASSWQLSNTPVKGYDLLILEGNSTMISVSDGETTANFKGTLQTLPDNIKVSFKAYY